MWGAITKDFGEFVTTVAADATETLESIDKNLDEPLIRGRTSKTNNNKEVEADDDSPDQPSSSEALIDPDTGIPLSPFVSDGPPLPTNNVPWKPPTEASPEEMKERLVSCEDVFLDSLVSEDAEAEEESPASAFVESFDVATKTEEISDLLKTDAALQTTFSMLSDAVSYKDFWTRYFYRIGEKERLPETYSVYYSKHLEAQAAAEAEAATAAQATTMGGLTSFFGGVVSKLTHEESGEYYDEAERSGDDAEASDVVDESLDQSTEDGPVAAARTALGFLSTVAGGAGRPPFVMNTAVSDDDDDEDAGATEDDEEEDEDSEVELGWDDDDDEDFDGLDDDDDPITDEIAFRDGDDRSETVDFKDAEKEGLLDELEQARAERDALQKTVQMQADELKKAAAAADLAESSQGKASSGSLGDANTQTLKLQLFEKDAELAALRSKLEDRHDDDEGEGGTDASAALQAEVDKLKEALASKDREFDALKQATQAQTRALEQKIEEQSKQKEELETLKGTVSAREKELSDLLKNRDDEASKLQHKVEEKQAEKEEMILALQSQIYALERQLEEKAPPPVSDQSVDEDEAEELREALASKDAEMAVLRTKATEAASQTSELQTKLSAKTEELKSQASATQTAISQLERQLVDETKLKEGLGAKVEGLQKELVAVKDEAKQALQTATDQHAATVGELQSKLKAMSNDLSASLEEAASAKQESEALRKELEEYNNRPPTIQPLRAPTSPLSSDSGVRVDVADASDAMAAISQPPPVMPSTPSAAVSLGLEPSEHDDDGADDDDDDGWGDDW